MDLDHAVVTPDTPSSYRADEVVTTLAYADFVAEELANLGFAPTDREPSSELGLCRLPLDADQLPDPGNSESAIDEVIRRFRQKCRADHGQWTPPIGKNRHLGHVDGAYVIGGWGDSGESLATPSRYALRTDGPDFTRPAGKDGQGARIGVIDTRLCPLPVLNGAYFAAADELLEPDGRPVPIQAGHATFVAGLLVTQAPAAELRPAGVLDDDAQADSWAVAQAIVRMARSGVDVLNLSLGCQTEDGQPPLVLAAAIDRVPLDVAIVAAAGKFTPTRDREDSNAVFGATWPAALPRVLAVGALDGDYAADFSPTEPWVDVYAQGVGLKSAYLDDRFTLKPPTGTQLVPRATGHGQWSGTSFAAAVVAGRIATRVGPGVDGSAALERLLKDGGSFSPDARGPWRAVKLD
jgi:hypothetical protein